MTELFNKAIGLKKIITYLYGREKEPNQDTKPKTVATDETPTKNKTSCTTTITLLVAMPIIVICIIILMSSIGFFLKFTILALTIISLGAYYIQQKNIDIYHIFDVNLQK